MCLNCKKNASGMLVAPHIINFDQVVSKSVKHKKLRQFIFYG